MTHDASLVRYGRLAELSEAGVRFVVATIVDVRGSAPQRPGARLVVRTDGVEGTVGGGRLEDDVVRRARRILSGGPPAERRQYRLTPAEDQCCTGVVDVFFERNEPRPQVLLCGAGHVAGAVARAIAPLQFDVTVLDSRADWATEDRFPAARVVVAEDPVAALDGLDATEDPERLYALVFTHSHRLDFALVEALLGLRPRMLGLIGSRAKRDRLLRWLAARGFEAAAIARVRCPIGVGVGGKSPEEIAAGVAVELLAARDGVEVAVRPARGLAAVILAAGRSTRMGTPKALLSVRGKPLVARQIESARAGGVLGVTVVVRPGEDAIRRAAEGAGATVVVNPDPDRGPFSSLQVGLCANPDAPAVFVLPVDVPAAGAEVWHALLSGASAEAFAVVPTVADRGGHPVLLGKLGIARVLAEPVEGRLDAVLASFGDRLVRVKVHDARVLLNLNDPADAAAFEEAG